jgi:hypothetical protein
MGAAATSTRDLGAGTASAGGGAGAGVDSRRFKMVVQRLMRICLIVTATWLLALSLDITTWTLFFQEKLPPNGVNMTRIIALRSIGLMDAVILGNLFQVGQSRDATGISRHGRADPFFSSFR